MDQGGGGQARTGGVRAVGGQDESGRWEDRLGQGGGKTGGHLSPSVSVFSRSLSTTRPTVSASLWGEWGILVMVVMVVVVVVVVVVMVVVVVVVVMV